MGSEADGVPLRAGAAPPDASPAELPGTTGSRWLALLELAYETILVRGVPGDRILYWSGGAAARYGWSAEEALGRVSHELLGTRAAQPLDRLAAQLHALGLWEGELVHVTRDGRERVIESRWALWRSPETGDCEILEIGRDVTELRHAEAERQHLAEKSRALQHLESLATLASGAAHDFNNLMMAVVANADAAAIDLGAGHRALRHLQRIDAAARHAAEITDRLRDYAGERRRIRTELRLDALITELAGLMRASLPAGVELEVESASQRSVMGDAVALRQVFLNLLTNAIDATGPGGRIQVRLDDVADAAELHLILDPDAPGPFVRIAVADSGPGIDPVILARIFDPFFSTRAGGRGLGLAVVMGVVRAHGGGIGVESRPGSGARVSVLVPIGKSRPRPPLDSPA